VQKCFVGKRLFRRTDIKDQKVNYSIYDLFDQFFVVWVVTFVTWISNAIKNIKITTTTATTTTTVAAHRVIKGEGIFSVPVKHTIFHNSDHNSNNNINNNSNSFVFLWVYVFNKRSLLTFESSVLMKTAKTKIFWLFIRTLLWNQTISIPNNYIINVLL